VEIGSPVRPGLLGCRATLAGISTESSSSGAGMRHRRDHDRDVAGALSPSHNDNRIGPVLRGLVSSTLGLIAPEAPDNQARCGGRKGHSGATPYSAASISAITSSESSPARRTWRSRAFRKGDRSAA
jgi:hypothetical protein